MTTTKDLFSAYATLDAGSGQPAVGYYRLSALRELAPNLDRLPFTIRVLLESLLRNCDGFAVTKEDVQRLASWDAAAPAQVELPFMPARVILQDFTGVPVLVDIAAMRAAVARLGGDPKQINPLVPVDLVIDHSVQVDYYGTADSLLRNVRTEFDRNRERYTFLRWGQSAVSNFRAVPPSTGIVHQVNLEYLAQGIVTRTEGGQTLVYPDTLVGTDSHTTMINGLAALGWGVGGIEAEAVMLGQPLFMLTPQVIGCRLSGRLKEGVTATDLVLTITQLLRKKGVVDKFVEFYGPGLAHLPLADRATIANMAPEYGATCGFFPFDQHTVDYLRATGRPEQTIALCEAYYKAQGLYRTDDMADPIFTDTVSLDLSTVEPSMAGPKRPQDRVPLSGMKSTFRKALSASVKDQGFAIPAADQEKTVPVTLPSGENVSLGHGAVLIAAITSCTNTSNPSVLVAAGLLAKKAVERGLKVAPHVKTSLAPGSKFVTAYLQESGLLPYLEKVGFYVVGYGCTTCIGNSGPLAESIEKAVSSNGLIASAVLSGNRNFEGRIHSQIKANYLASPPLCVAYALAGTVDRDLSTEAIGNGSDGQPVYLADIWPTQAEVQHVLNTALSPALFKATYASVFEGTPEWQQVGGGQASELYAFDDSSTYIQEPPFFSTMQLAPDPIRPITGARALAVLGDSVTTDHISPAGDIPAKGPAGEYLQAHGVHKVDFNSFGARRGNDRVMVRGTFANIRLKNLLVPGVEGGVTVHLPTGERMSIFDASARYQKDGTPLFILAGKEYGTGSSRDWAAKGTLLLGVRVVIAESFERIHRANLVGMGVLPLVFEPGQNVESLGLTGREYFSVQLPEDLQPRQTIQVEVRREDGTTFTFGARSRLDTPIDVRYYQNGGILQTVLRDLIQKSKS
ncbi:MAG TPA: aconitate hydratase AcnA [Pseudomonadota bacterium]|nr:aconitate hydratase AcnA [Pseudomonadota bacterium]